MFGRLILKALRGAVKEVTGRDDEKEKGGLMAKLSNEEKEKRMLSLPTKWFGREDEEDEKETLMEGHGDMENIDLEVLEGLGALFGRRGGGNARRSGKARHAGGRKARREARKDGGVKISPLSSEELRAEAGITKAAVRYDDGDVFQAYSGNKEFWVRTGTEIFMGMDDALVTITAATVGTFTASPNKEVEIQGLRCQVVGAGASAAATIAIEETLLANLAFTYINVGDDKMITGANYVGANVLIDRETDMDLAGFITTPTQAVTMGVLDSAAFDAKVFITVIGELVVLYGL